MALQALADTFCHLSMKIPDYRPKARTLILVDSNSHSCVCAAATNAMHGISGQIYPSRDFEVVVKPYAHLEAQSLASRLKKFYRDGDRIMVLTDSVFSMEGSIAPLPDILAVLKDYQNAVLVCDEAHSSGVIGPSGGGIFDHYGIKPSDLHAQNIEPILLTTFSKFGGSVGAALSSFNKDFIDLLDAARTSSGTASLPPSLTASALASINLTLENPHIVHQLQENIDYLRYQLANAGVQAMGKSAIISVDVGDKSPKDLADILMVHHGIWVTPVWFVGKPSLRLIGSALYSRHDMDELVKSLAAILTI